MLTLALLTSVAAPSVWGADPSPLPLIHPLFSDHGVLQRGRAIPVWGWSTPGASVVVSIAGRSLTAAAGADGRWQTAIGPFTTGQGPFDLTVAGPAGATVVHNLLVGEVWLMSGQSNMAWGVSQAADPEQVLKEADRPRIRLYAIPQSWGTKPQQVPTNLPWVGGNVTWAMCTPTTAKDFSAIGYHFAVELQQRLGGVPIGVIGAGYGGAAAEGFLPEAAVTAFGGFEAQLAEGHRVWNQLDQGTYDRAKDLVAWQDRLGTAGGDPAVLSKDPTADQTWEDSPLPGNWEANGLKDVDGIVWYRRAFTVPAGASVSGAVLTLGPIDDQDVTWINGQEVGRQSGWQTPRRYEIPAGVLTPGSNLLAVRVLDTGGGGGLCGQPQDLALTLADGTAIPLAGSWKRKLGATTWQLPPQPVDYSPSGWPMSPPTIFFNRMIAPIAGYPLAGVGWYQGESNVGRHDQYRKLLPHLIGTWRSLWKQDDLPFLIVQLAGYQARHAEPEAFNAMADLMLAQAAIAKSVTHAGLACAYDIGQADDIHPKNKREVARRLAYPALAIAYPKHAVKGVTGSPTVHAIRRDGAAVVVTVSYAGTGLKSKSEKTGIPGFALAGQDGKLVWATATITGPATIRIEAPGIAAPVRVQFAYDNNPEGSLYNSEDLPLVPFMATVP